MDLEERKETEVARDRQKWRAVRNWLSPQLSSCTHSFIHFGRRVPRLAWSYLGSRLEKTQRTKNRTGDRERERKKHSHDGLAKPVPEPRKYRMPRGRSRLVRKAAEQSSGGWWVVISASVPSGFSRGDGTDNQGNCTGRYPGREAHWRSNGG